MTVVQAFLPFAVMALATIASAAPTTKPEPFHLPATYLTGGDGSMSIDFNEDGTFSTSRTLAPSVCANKPVCPEMGGHGTWAYASGLITIKQRIAPYWKVTQVWRLGVASRDFYSSNITGNRLLMTTGESSDKFPLPLSSVNWKRANVPSDVERPKPFLLPATFLTNGVGRVSFTINEDGTFRTRRDLPHPSCAGRPFCPERGGKGTWTWSKEKNELTLKEEITADWTIEQVWELNGVSRDANLTEVTGVRLVSSKGRDASKYPIPEGISHWRRSS